MAPKSTVDVGNFNAFMGSFKLVSPYALQLAESERPEFCGEGNRRFGSIQEEEEEEEEEEDEHAAVLGEQGTLTDGRSVLLRWPSSSSSSSSSLSSMGACSQSVPSLSPSTAVASVNVISTNRQIMQCLCSSALILFSITALLLVLPLVLPPLPPPPSELMLLPVAILMLLICAALSPRPTPSPSSAASAQQSISPLMPLAHSLPLRSSMPAPGIYICM